MCIDLLIAAEILLSPQAQLPLCCAQVVDTYAPEIRRVDDAGAAFALAASGQRESAYAGGMAHTISERKLRQRLKEFAPERERQTRRELRHAQRILELWNKRARAGRRTSGSGNDDHSLGRAGERLQAVPLER
jgi:hypothetical protein